MTDLEKILLTSGLTIIGGVFVFCIGQTIQRFLLEPIQELRKTIGEICFRLNYYANISPRDFEKASDTHKEMLSNVFNAFRESALRLEPNAVIISFYDFF